MAPSLANYLRDNPQPLDPLSLGRTLVLAPHPDDESLGCGGTIAMLRQADVPVYVVFITDGTQSHPNSPTYPAERLREVREAEAIEACRILGVPKENVAFMRLPDRNVPTKGHFLFDESVRFVFEMMKWSHPQCVLVPYERDPHPDHRATFGLLNIIIENVLAAPRMLEYLIWLWELGNEDDLPKPDERRTWRVDIDPVADVKKQAIAAHKSQVTQMIDDDPDAFYLSPELLKHFDVPYELYVEKPRPRYDQ